MSSTHYTAVLEITSTDVVEEKADNFGKVTTSGSRKVNDVARIVVRAGSLEALTERLSAHAALIEEVDA